MHYSDLAMFMHYSKMVSCTASTIVKSINRKNIVRLDKLVLLNEKIQDQNHENLSKNVCPPHFMAIHATLEPHTTVTKKYVQ